MVFGIIPECRSASFGKHSAPQCFKHIHALRRSPATCTQPRFDGESDPVNHSRYERWRDAPK
jgi:hypothetical protein